jgi:hypothetical protein
MSRKEDCNYPNCINCNSEFAIPTCMLDEANIQKENSICIIPKDGYVIIKNDEEDETLEGG